MDERRDLVDREELRRNVEELRGKYDHGTAARDALTDVLNMMEGCPAGIPGSLVTIDSEPSGGGYWVRREGHKLLRLTPDEAFWLRPVIVRGAMPAVECPRGWTRDEVLAELDADPDAVCEQQSVQMAEWFTVPTGAIGSWHPEVRRYDVRVVRVAPEPEWVPLTQLVGRTIAGCTGVVDRDPSALSGEGWRWYDGREWHPFPEGTLNLETGQVAVRPKAAT